MKWLFRFGLLVNHLVQDVTDVLETFNEVGGGRVLNDSGEGLSDGLLVGRRGDVRDDRGFGGEDDLRVIEKVHLMTYQ